MGLFGKKKKETAACGCAGGCNAPAVDTSRGVFVLGGGCAKCNELEASVRAALAELGRQEEVESTFNQLETIWDEYHVYETVEDE